MAIRPQRLTVRGFTGIDDSLSQPEDHSKAFWMMDCYCEDHARPASVVLRGGWKRVGSTTVGTAVGTARFNGEVLEWFTAAGTAIRMVVSGGQIYTLSVLAVPSLVVTTANLTTATITLNTSGPIFAVPFQGQVVISDGTNTPFMWDGTSGAGGLTKLTNAPVAFGPPTVYYAKLFFIKNSDRGTIVWSEENSANTGYEAGGFNNAWTLSQTGTRPLLAIAGTNEGLYYFRRDSIGIIRGAVTTTFSTTGTHDGVSGGTGIFFNGFGRPYLHHGGYLWFFDQLRRACRLLPGGPVEELWRQSQRNVTSSLVAALNPTVRPFNLGEQLNVGDPLAILPHPATGHVFFAGSGGPSYTTAIKVARFSASTGQLVGQERWNDFSNSFGAIGYITSFNNGTDIGILAGVAEGDVGTPNTVGIIRTYGVDLSYNHFWGSDQYGTASSTTYTGLLIGPAQGYGESTEWQFDEVAIAYEGNDTTASTVGLQYLTDHQHYSTLMSAEMTSTATDAAYILKEQRARFGIAGNGSWIRLVVSMTGTDRVAIKGWDVFAYPVAQEAVRVG